MIYKTLHINLTTLAMYPAKWRQIQMGVRYLDISLSYVGADLFSVANGQYLARSSQNVQFFENVILHTYVEF